MSGVEELLGNFLSFLRGAISGETSLGFGDLAETSKGRTFLMAGTVWVSIAVNGTKAVAQAGRAVAMVWVDVAPEGISLVAHEGKASVMLFTSVLVGTNFLAQLGISNDIPF